MVPSQASCRECAIRCASIINSFPHTSSSKHNQKLCHYSYVESIAILEYVSKSTSMTSESKWQIKVVSLNCISRQALTFPLPTTLPQGLENLESSHLLQLAGQVHVADIMFGPRLIRGMPLLCSRRSHNVHRTCFEHQSPQRQLICQGDTTSIGCAKDRSYSLTSK